MLPRMVLYYLAASADSARAALVVVPQQTDDVAHLSAYIDGYWIDLGDRPQCDPAQPTAGCWSEIPA
jgi:hypothetical protein